MNGAEPSSFLLNQNHLYQVYLLHQGFVIVGESGSGKSTLVRAAFGMLKQEYRFHANTSQARLSDVSTGI